MISKAQKDKAYATLRAAGFNPNETRELLAGPSGLRDGLAGKAMAAIIPTADVTSPAHRAELATISYQIADALLLERGGTP